MGDRGNIAIRQRDGAFSDGSFIYFYTHWRGSKLPVILQEALKREARWNDGPYLARIIFGEMTRDTHDDETGYGISNEICDNEHHILEVDSERQQVRDRDTGNTWSFRQFVNLDIKGNGLEGWE